MTASIFGSLFGGGSPEGAVNQQKQAVAANEQALRDWLEYRWDIALGVPKHTLPVGIFWTRTGGKNHRVVIRRTEEVVIDLSNLGAR